MQHPQETTRIESSVTSISWIPSKALEGVMALAQEIGPGHFDNPPPESLTDLGNLDEARRADRFRFANQLRGWIEVADGKITGHGQDGAGHVGVTVLRFGPLPIVFGNVRMPDLRPPPEVGDGWVRFVQTAGGRTSVPLPRRVKGRVVPEINAPLVWTTLALTIHATGHAEIELAGASEFPRHWVYDHDGRIALKSGVMDWVGLLQRTGGTEHTPWGGEDSSTLTAIAESALERQISQVVMHGEGKPEIRKFAQGDVIARQGDPGPELFLLLDGIVEIEVNGQTLAQAGPGAILGERSLLEKGTRTATLRAATVAKAAAVPGDRVAPDLLKELARGHQREYS